MDTYRKTLLLLKDLLHKSNNSHWEQWIDRDIYEWDNSKSTSHHKSAFGGMGSINDLWVGGSGLERYISNKHLPAIIANLLPTDQYLDLTNFEALTNKSEIALDRQKLLNALTEFKINFSKTDNWLKTCPICESSNTCVYRWDVSNTSDKIISTRSKNNLTVNSDKIKIAWWKRQQ